MRAVGERLGDIMIALERIERRLATCGIRSSEGLDDESLAIVAWSLLTVGEAIKALPRRVTTRHVDVDWRGLAGLRDQLAHRYFRIEREILWNIVLYDLPPLRTAIEAELRRPGAAGAGPG